MPKPYLSNHSQKTCLIYGGCGFIGYHLSSLLLNQGFRVISVDNFSINRHQNSQALSSSSNFYHLETNPNQLALGKSEAVDYLIILAGSEIFNNDIDDNYYKFVKNNFYVQELVEIGQKKQAKMLFVSTSKYHLGYFPSTEEVQKNEVLRVSLNYAEQQIAQLRKNHNLNIRLARIANLIGPGQNLNQLNYLTHIICQAFQKQRVELPADGLIHVAPSFVDDVALGMAKALFADHTDGKIFNLLNHQSISLLNLVYTLADIYQLEIIPSFNSRLFYNKLSIHPQDTLNLEVISWQHQTPIPVALKKTISDLQTRNQVSSLVISESNMLSAAPLKSHQAITAPTPAFSPLPSQLTLKKNRPPTNLSSPAISAMPKSPISEINPKISPSVVTSNLADRVGHALLTLTKPLKKINIQKFKKPSLKLSLPVFILIFVVFFYFLPSFFLNQTLSAIQSRILQLQPKIETPSPQFEKQLTSLEKQISLSENLAQLVIWQNHLLSKSMPDKIVAALDTNPLILSIYKNLFHVHQFSASQRRQLFSSSISDSGQDYQLAINNNLNQASQNIALLMTKFEIHPSLKQQRQAFIPIQNKINSWQKINQILPAIISSDEKKHVLILIQDNLEIRPTGGFISAVASLTSQAGSLIDFNVYDIFDVEARLKGRVSPPVEFQKYGFENNWFFRDINFSPSFSCYYVDINLGQHCVAGDAIWFSKQALSLEPQSVIAINLNTLALILDSIGPVFLPSLNETIDASNLSQRAYLLAQTNRNDFIVELINIIFEKIKNDDQIQLLNLINALSSSLDSSDSLIYSTNNSYQAKIEEYGWGGSLRPLPEQLAQFGHIQLRDYLAIFESNFSYRKNNHLTQTSLDHQLKVDANGRIVAQSQFLIKNNATTQAWPSGDYDKNYLRFIIPQNTSLKSVTIRGADAKTRSLASAQIDRKEEGTYRSIGFLTSIPIQSQSEITLTYEHRQALDFSLPDGANYAFYLQKQSGSYPSDYKISIFYPEKLSLKKISPTPDSLDSPIIFTGSLDQDKIFVINFSQN